MWTMIDKLKNIRGFHLVHLNIRSLWQHMDEFRFYLKDSNINCATISESWLNEKIPSNLVDIQGYNLFRLDRQTLNETDLNQTKNGGGVCAYIKSDITVLPNELQDLNRSTTDIEAQWLLLQPEHQKKFILVNLYRPPKGIYRLFLII